MTRRSWHERILMFLSSVMGVGLGAPAVGYLVNPSQSEGEAGWTDAGAVNTIPEAKPTEVTIERERKDAWRTSVEKTTAWVLREGEQVTAFAPGCTHLGCGYRWIEDQEHFLCPCHDTTFAKDGAVLTGPAPRPLDQFQVRVEGGRLWLGGVEKSEG